MSGKSKTAHLGKNFKGIIDRTDSTELSGNVRVYHFPEYQFYALVPVGREAAIVIRENVFYSYPTKKSGHLAVQNVFLYAFVLIRIFGKSTGMG